MLGLLLLAQAAFAPETFSDMIVISHYSSATGPCMPFQNSDYMAIFGNNGAFVAYQLGGDISYDGTYTYSRINDTDGQVTYHAVSGSNPWQGNFWNEVFHFTTFNKGTVYYQPPTGPTGQTGQCGYEGSFTLQPQ